MVAEQTELSKSNVPKILKAADVQMTPRGTHPGSQYSASDQMIRDLFGPSGSSSPKTLQLPSPLGVPFRKQAARFFKMRRDCKLRLHEQNDRYAKATARKHAH